MNRRLNLIKNRSFLRVTATNNFLTILLSYQSIIAVNDCYILFITLEPGINIITEWFHHLKRWRVVYVKWVGGNCNHAFRK